jgi:cysteinyl-tRNA synthetase
MAMHYLGETFDIHTGGVDNIFPHHVNEMAQSEGATGAPFARYWLHAAHLLVDGGKMSKSLGNFHTLGSLLPRGARPSAIRYLLLSAHYRSQLNFTLDGLAAADRAVTRLWEFRERLAAASGGGGLDTEDGEAEARRLAGAWNEAFEVAMNDDLAVSGALAATFDLVRDGNVALDAGRLGPSAATSLREAVDRFDAVFGVLALRAREEEIDDPEFTDWVEEQIEARSQARAERDFALADTLREELEARGVVLEDTPSGTRWKRSAGVDLQDSDLAAGRS